MSHPNAPSAPAPGPAIGADFAPPPPNANAAAPPHPPHPSHGHGHHYHQYPPPPHAQHHAPAPPVAPPSSGNGSRKRPQQVIMPNPNQPYPPVPPPSSATAVPSSSTVTPAKSKKNAKSDNPTPPSTSTKASKGLRHFSMRVCKKVEEKGHTSYNEVADELVKEFVAQRRAELEAAGEDPDAPPPASGGRKRNGEPATKKGKKSPGSASDRGYDEKNIRRRVYDALNVLMAMDIISKEKKQITWKGLPSSAHHDLELLQRERMARVEEVRRKQECLQELLVQNVCFGNLVKRNRTRGADGKGGDKNGDGAKNHPQPAKGGAAATTGAAGADRDPPPSQSSKGGKPADAEAGTDSGAATTMAGFPTPSSSAPKSNTNPTTPPPGTVPPGTPSATADHERSNFPVPLPFIVVNTSSQAIIKCDMNPDRTDVMFDFSLPFEINDDNEILKRLQLDKTTVEDARALFPRDLFLYAQEHHLLDHILVPPDRLPTYGVEKKAMTGGGDAGGTGHPSQQQQQQSAPQPSSREQPYHTQQQHGDGSARSAYSPPRNAMPPYGPPTGRSGRGQVQVQPRPVVGGGGGAADAAGFGPPPPPHGHSLAGPPPPPHAQAHAHAVGGGGRGYERE